MATTPSQNYGDSRPNPFYFELRDKIAALGIDDFSLVPIGDAASYSIYLERLEQGCCDGLEYLSENPEARRSPRSVLENAATMIVVALAEARLRDESRAFTDALFESPELRVPASDDLPRGEIVGYAACLDYHDALRKRLKALAAFFRERFPDASTRPAVDTAPILEKDWAIQSGLGFLGLNSLVAHPRFGSRFFIGELLVSTPFKELSGFESSEEFLEWRSRSSGLKMWKNASDPDSECRKCRRCAEACPTGAIVGDGTLNARLCLNYWTIENREEMPSEIASRLGDRLFGCDLCRSQCPLNARAGAAPTRTISLDAVESLDEETFRRLFKKTPIFRARVEGLRRTAATLKEGRNMKRKEPPEKKPDD